MKILITGASGSIGKELVHQLIENNEIICYDRNEEKIFYLEKEIKEKYPNSNLVICLGTITDQERLYQIFEKYKPDVVYHTAANKHVPLGEQNIHEFVYNNIKGTINMINISIEYNSKFIFISTDKAVEPTSIMGYTKRMCEKYLLALNKNIIICRFGNIIGSSGSVYEIFDKQVKTGVITLTHPEMERYFINIQKAVENLIICSTFKPGLYIFNMGEPIKIIDIIKSYESKYKIEIKIIGLRDGEKIKEKLIYDFETIKNTSNIDIFEIITNIDKFDIYKITKLVNDNNIMKEDEIINMFKYINKQNE